MNCKNYSNLIPDLVAGDLDSPTEDKVSAHVFACPYCEKEFDLLSREKEIYQQFLFEIEPPKNLTRQFQARLAREMPMQTPKINFKERFAGIFSALNLMPIAAAFCVLAAFAGGWLWLKYSLPDAEKTIAVNAEKTDILPPAAFADREISPAPEQIILPAKKQVEPNPPKKFGKGEIVKIKSADAKPKTSETPETQIKKPASKPQKLIADQEILRELQAFEIETAKQIEKIEMLLRSFRNSRFSEDTEQYDVDYERAQARKLLETNAKLRRQAEFYEAFYALEMLDKVETYLLDIANLENNPSAEKILDIKQRVRNQNLIASLQGF